MAQAKAPIIASLIILVLILLFFTVGGLIVSLLNLPRSPNLPLVLRIVGALVIGTGGALILWLMKYRKPQDMIVSTYYTFAKMISGSSIQEMSGRSEPLVVQGPQKIVRHPLYLGALLAFLGWGLLTNSTSNLIATLVALIWYAVVQIPFEEKELRALFGEQYVKYMCDTPMLVPFTKQRKRSRSSL